MSRGAPAGQNRRHRSMQTLPAGSAQAEHDRRHQKRDRAPAAAGSRRGSREEAGILRLMVLAQPQRTALCPKCGRRKRARADDSPWKHSACWPMLSGDAGSGACFSKDRLSRYRLWRRWGEGGYALWVLLNPSTADHNVDDPTIDKLLLVTRGLGLAALSVVNLDARIQPKSAAVLRFEQRDWENERHIESLAATATRVIVAWGGVDRKDRRERIGAVLTRLVAAGWQVGGLGERSLLCIAETADLYPGHPQRRRVDDMSVRPWQPPRWAVAASASEA